MVKIKIATKTDTKLVALLGRITYIESHGHFIDDKNDLSKYVNKAFSVLKTQQDIESPNNLFYIIYVDDLPIGYAKLILNAKQENVTSSNCCRLERIYILNEFIPMKIGQQFLTFVEDKARELKLDTMWLSVYIKNKRGIRFYQRNEFNNVGELNFQVNGKGYVTLVYSKAL